METQFISDTLTKAFVGKQYQAFDNRNDKSGFLCKARMHESVRRAEMGLEYDRYGNYLTDKDAKDGKNFYNKEIADYAALRYPSKPDKVFSNMLRSEHIPLNFFVPFIADKDFCRLVMNQLFGDTIKQVVDVKIEYAPGDVEINGKTKKNNKPYLNDATSFDAYIEYIHVDGSKGAFGIEVKFTEREYALKKGSKEFNEVTTLLTADSIYYKKTVESGLYKSEFVKELLEDKDVQDKKLVQDLFRQMWRNHILGTSMKSVDGFSHFTSVLLYPKDNEHFDKIAIPQYRQLLNDSRDFVGITYEQFINAIEKCCTKFEDQQMYGAWIDYLRNRYIVIDWIWH